MEEPNGYQLVDGSRVAVMGGGPAGSFFSYFLLAMAQRSGIDIKVDVYEAKDFSRLGPPGCNMCGGIVHESLVQILATEGINLPPTVVQRGIDSHVLHTGEGSARIETPAQEKRIVLPSSQMFFICMLSPLVDGPMMAKTCSSSISCFAKEMAFSALAPESLMINSILTPLTPPLELSSSASISRVLDSGAPRKDAGPVTASIAPTFTVSDSFAPPAKDNETVTTQSNTRIRSFFNFIAKNLFY